MINSLEGSKTFAFPILRQAVLAEHARYITSFFGLFPAGSGFSGSCVPDLPLPKPLPVAHGRYQPVDDTFPVRLEEMGAGKFHNRYTQEASKQNMDYHD